MDDDLAIIARRAAHLELGPTAVGRPQPGEPDAEALLERWQQAAAQGDPVVFARRLALDGLDRGAALRALGGGLTPGEDLPGWAHTLAEVLALAAELAAQPATDEPDRCLDPDEPLPFEHVLLPFVILARRRLARAAGPGYQRLSDDCLGLLEGNLLSRLANLAGQALEREFSLFRARSRDGLARFAAGADPRHHYRRFVAGLLGGGLRGLFREYSALARLLVTIVELWVAANAELFDRLEADAPALSAAFEAPCDYVVQIIPALSDFHRGGRSVAALTFAGGLRLVYKPKSLAPEAAFAGLLAWLNSRAEPADGLPELRGPALLDRGDYGWMQYVAAAPCADDAAARRYYRRCGALLCLMHLLDGTDLHHENLIAAGEHPLLIDLEGLLHPRLRKGGAEVPRGAHELAYARLYASVLRSGLLPSWERGGDGRAEDVSGLGAADRYTTDQRLPAWVEVNTDRMALRFERETVAASDHQPSLAGAALTPDQYAGELVAGFRACYTLLMRRHVELLAADGPLARFAPCAVRAILRDTRTYAGLLFRLANPRFLRTGVARSIEIERLAASVLRSASAPRLWPIYLSERSALERLDIPVFAAYCDSSDLITDAHGPLAGCLEESGIARVRRRAAALDEADLLLQVEIIGGTLAAYAARLPTARPAAATATSRAASLDGAAALGSPLSAALSIAEDLERRAIRAADGSATWVGLVFEPGLQRFQFQPLGDDLYSGSSGVALFLAALARVSGEEHWRELALAALRPVIGRMQSADYGAELLRESGIGGATGVAAITYALLGAGRLLGEGELVEAAARVAALITPAQIRADTRYDVMEGAAGAILSLLALYRRRADPQLLDAAQRCGERLLEARVVGAGGLRAWPDADGQLLTGFSHGAAGIAYALLRLHAAAGDGRLRAAAAEAFAYERGLLNHEAGNWPDLRANAASLADQAGGFWAMESWCHGAPGIGLARIGALPALDTRELRDEIAIALATTGRAGTDDVDHLCCGNAGRAEILMAAGRALGRPQLVEEARAIMAAVLRRAGPTLRFQLFNDLPPGSFNAGLFVGTAGIGYTLLRLHQPDLPSVLLWE